MSDGTIVRWLDRPRWKSPLPVWSGDPPAPIAADWAVITAFPESNVSPAVFVLEFLTQGGDVGGHFQFETLEIALDQAKAIAEIDPSAWQACEVRVPHSLAALSTEAFAAMRAHRAV